MIEDYLKNITSYTGTKILLDDFVKNKIRFYKGYRNQDLGGLTKNYVSGLSPDFSFSIINSNIFLLTSVNNLIFSIK